MTSRNEVFQKLKPHCIRLSQDALALAGNSSNTRAVVLSLEKLLCELRTVQSQRGDLDGRIAEYCFFPLSHILKNSQKLPGRALELTLECLIVLLDTGWKQNVSKDLAVQLLILLSFLGAAPDAKSTSLESSEELQEAAFRCLFSLLSAAARSTEAKASLLAVEFIPHTGKCVSVMLDGIVLGRSSAIQLAAAQSFVAFLDAVTDQDALATFLPGAVSSLSRCLTPNTQARRSFKVIQTSLQGLEQILRLVLSDARTKDLPQDAKSPEGSHTLTQTWLRASGTQVKQALSNVVRQRYHGREEVNRAMVSLCNTVLQECRMSLADCAEMLVDTLVVLSQDDMKDNAGQSLRILLQTQPDRIALLKSLVHNWTSSLPRVMTAQNDTAKTDILRRISSTFRLLHEERQTLMKLDESLATNLRDCLITVMKAETTMSTASARHTVSVIGELTLRPPDQVSAQFDSIFGSTGQSHIVSELQTLLEQLSAADAAAGLAPELLATAQNAKGEVQLASFWLAKTLIECAPRDDLEITAFVDLGEDNFTSYVELQDDLYSLSLSLVVESVEDFKVDPRLQALALETVAFQARFLGTDFRPELIEALYPMLHLMGSSHNLVRDHAFTCINIVSQSCGYRSASDMIVQNVDYLVNAVSLKLNAFELSPQAPQVLLMMIKLSGPALLPYLDDLVASMFSALESFHGYPKLVELLFGVFKAITEEGVKIPAFAIKDISDSPCPSITERPPLIQDVALELKELREHLCKSRATEEHPEPFPLEAWKTNAEIAAEVEENTKEVTPTADDPAPPSQRTYNLLLRIAQLTQHYLPASSPSLRTSLLSLLSSTIPALAVHENSFLPLINTLWPVLVPRLEDPEAFIVSNAMKVITLMCCHGGDFMKSRINDIWPTLMGLDPRKKWILDRKKLVNTENVSHILPNDTSSNAAVDAIACKRNEISMNYVDSPSRMIWNNLVELLKTIVTNISIDETKYEDVLEFLRPLWDREDVKLALEAFNPDAFWLKMRHEE